MTTKCSHHNSIPVDIDGVGEDLRFCNDCGENFSLTAGSTTPSAVRWPPVPDDQRKAQHEIERQILNLIESSIEDSRVLDAIAAHADKRAGKPVTKTDAEQIEAQVGVPVRIQRRHGMTHVAWAVGKDPHPWSDERSILIAYAETGVRWPSGDELKQKEAGYFACRDQRNEARRKLLAEHHQHERIPYINPSAIEQAAAAIVKIREAQAELEKLTEGPLNVVLYAVEQLAKEGS